VVEPVVAKKFVEVLFVVVELRPVKFCNVVDPRVSMFANVPRPDEVMFPPFADVKNRFVEDAVPANKVVVVALVVVERVNTAVEGVTAPIVVFSIVPSFIDFATKAAGTAPKIFLGDISPSHVGEPLDPPISTPRYKG
jgi:hypothetical protein